MKIFNINESKMKDTKSTFTLNEIFQQPKTWIKTLEQIKANKISIQAFINNVITKEDYDVIFTSTCTS